MNVVFTVVAALGLGFFVHRRGTAVLAYLVADSFLFTFQTLDVTLNWMSGARGAGGAEAFGPSPIALPLAYRESEVFAYGVVNLIIVAVGVGLTMGANRLAARRAARKSGIAVA